jgi:uncharacterized membrane protein
MMTTTSDKHELSVSDYNHLDRLMVVATPLGRFVLACGVFGWGVLSLIYGDFALQWQPVPAGIPARTALAYASGLILTAGGLCLIFRRTVPVGAGILAFMMAFWVLVLHSPKVFAGEAAAWLALFECLALAGGFWIIVGAHTTASPGGWGRVLGANAVRAGRFCFAVSLPAFGVSHFVYFDGAAGMVPAWIPWPGFWTAFTGVAHIAAGLSLLTNVASRLAAPLVGLMFSLFVILLHMPRVIHAPGDRLEWTMLFAAALLTGAAWTVTGSLLASRAAR